MAELFKRHRRKIVGTGLFVGGSYALYRLVDAHPDLVLFFVDSLTCDYRYVRYKLEQHTQMKLDEMLEQSRRNHNFVANQQSCMQTVVSFLPNIQTIIAKYFDSQQLRSSLDENPQKKVRSNFNLQFLYP